MPESHTITIRDETPGRKPVHELALTFDAHEVTLRTVIAERVRMEIDRYNQKIATSLANALVQPTDAEARLNTAVKKREPFRPIDAEKQIETAFRAFERNGFFVLVGSRQIENLDDTVSLTDNAEISFIKLTPLVGG